MAGSIFILPVFYVYSTQGIRKTLLLLLSYINSVVEVHVLESYTLHT